MRVLFACLLLLCVAGAAGCGQKGPLYLPVTPPRTIPPMPSPAPQAVSRTPAAATHPVPAAFKPR